MLEFGGTGYPETMSRDDFGFEILYINPKWRLPRWSTWSLSPFPLSPYQKLSFTSFRHVQITRNLPDTVKNNFFVFKFTFPLKKLKFATLNPGDKFVTVRFIWKIVIPT